MIPAVVFHGIVCCVAILSSVGNTIELYVAVVILCPEKHIPE